jgi:pyruvate-ferredoxin/flavodoxin oxidoreductase
MGQVRYTSLIKDFPNEAEALFVKAEKDSKDRYQTYTRLARD